MKQGPGIQAHKTVFPEQPRKLRECSALNLDTEPKFTVKALCVCTFNLVNVCLPGLHIRALTWPLPQLQAHFCSTGWPEPRPTQPIQIGSPPSSKLIFPLVALATIYSDKLCVWCVCLAHLAASSRRQEPSFLCLSLHPSTKPRTRTELMLPKCLLSEWTWFSELSEKQTWGRGPQDEFSRENYRHWRQAALWSSHPRLTAAKR